MVENLTGRLLGPVRGQTCIRISGHSILSALPLSIIPQVITDRWAGGPEPPWGSIPPSPAFLPEPPWLRPQPSGGGGGGGIPGEALTTAKRGGGGIPGEALTTASWKVAHGVVNLQF